MSCVRYVAMYLSHTETLVLAGTLREKDIPLLTTLAQLFCVGAIITNYFLNIFYNIVSDYGSCVIIARKPAILVYVLTSVWSLKDPPIGMYHIIAFISFLVEGFGR